MQGGGKTPSLDFEISSALCAFANLDSSSTSSQTDMFNDFEWRGVATRQYETIVNCARDSEGMCIVGGWLLSLYFQRDEVASQFGQRFGLF